MGLHDKCPKCQSERIESVMARHIREVGCLCGFMSGDLDPYCCLDCKNQWDNYRHIEWAYDSDKCWWDNPNCPTYGKKGVRG